MKIITVKINYIKILKVGGAILIVAALSIGLYLANYWNLIPKKHYAADDFGIETIVSTVDFNQNGIDDYTDIMLGARRDAVNKPKYDGCYWYGGYPPDNIGVCTDVVWRAFRNAGYSLKKMVDLDIKENIGSYPRTEGLADPNIDFRRVPNLKVFFERFATNLTLDPKEIEQWQPGDIVTYYPHHIAVVSDKRNKHGIPYIIHNEGQPVREEDALTRYKISGHFRFDASKLDESLMIEY